MSNAITRHGLSDRHLRIAERGLGAWAGRFETAIQTAGFRKSDLSRAIGLSRGAAGNWGSAFPNLREVCIVAHELNVEPATLMPTLAELRGTPSTPAPAPNGNGNGAGGGLAAAIAEALLPTIRNEVVKSLAGRIAEEL